VGQGRRSRQPQNQNLSKTSHTAPQTPQTFLACYSFEFGAYVEFQPVGCSGWALGGLCKGGGKETMLGAHASTRGASPKMRKNKAKKRKKKASKASLKYHKLTEWFAKTAFAAEMSNQMVFQVYRPVKWQCIWRLTAGLWLTTVQITGR